MSTPHDSPLGRSAAYPDRYDPALLFPIARAPQRAALGIDPGRALPFHGVDIWNAYELSWLDARGKPEVAIGELRVPATTPNIVESKSLKLYLASFHNERLPDADAVRERIARDLSAAAGADVAVALTERERFTDLALSELDGESIDALPVAIESYGPPDSTLLAAAGADVEETLVSNLLKSNCPVTGQPDWASIRIRYAGPRIDRAGLLRYLVSFRDHADFHEHCVERIHVDLMRTCAPRRLEIQARYTRRGGLDINPWRSSEPGDPPNPRTARQ
ncbi:MAG TPA: NADPH-dependent 7-cyano-7-deazaguanine reductase QueF [Rhodanobacteraceae bacterium]|nr:NADPH-dependent 7-cyano-7-deazaguanine reductase QueF [Rhodanobacteraceae bacterium]